MTTIEMTADQVSTLMPQLPPAARALDAGFSYDGETLTIPDTFADAAASIMAKPGWDTPTIDLKAYAASARYAKETSGITVGNAPIATDRDSQGMITGAWSAAQINPAISVAWKTAGGFVNLNAAQIQAIAAAVASHVQACFAAEAQLVADIAAGKVTATAQIDAAFAAVTV